MQAILFGLESGKYARSLECLRQTPIQELTALHVANLDDHIGTVISSLIDLWRI